MKDCVSLEIAKQLKEAGWKLGKSNLHWYVYTGKDAEIQPNIAKVRVRSRLWKNYPAASIGELLEALPKEVERRHLCLGSPTGTRWWAMYDGIAPLDSLYITKHPNLADVLASLWMELKKEGIV